MRHKGDNARVDSWSACGLNGGYHIERGLTLSLLLEDELSLLIVVLVLPSPAVLSSLFSVGRQRVTGVSAGLTPRKRSISHAPGARLTFPLFYEVQ